MNHNNIPGFSASVLFNKPESKGGKGKNEPHAFHTRENLSYRGSLPAKHHFQKLAMQIRLSNSNLKNIICLCKQKNKKKATKLTHKSVHCKVFKTARGVKKRSGELMNHSIKSQEICKYRVVRLDEPTTYEKKSGSFKDVFLIRETVVYREIKQL